MTTKPKLVSPPSDPSDDDATVQGAGSARPTWRGHLEIMRIDHWTKTVFVLPGLVVAWSMDPAAFGRVSVASLLTGLAAVCLMASSNYVINELLDARYDRFHQTKRRRPFPEGRVSRPLAYVQWLVLAATAVGLASTISLPFTLVIVVLWVMGCLYNIPPIRTKDIVYIDVISEAANNLLRLLAGWFLAGTAMVPPTSLAISYWMVGAYFMALKRLAEYRSISDPVRSGMYRRSFKVYTEHNLISSSFFYGSNAMLFLGAFIMRYRLELILAFPALAAVMTIYLSIALEQDSAAQRPEHLYREPAMAVALATSAAIMILLLFVDIPLMHDLFEMSRP